MKKRISYKLDRVYCQVKDFWNEVTPKASHVKPKQLQKTSISPVFLDIGSVIYFLQKNTRLYTKAFIQLLVSWFLFRYKRSLDLARIMILASRRGLRLFSKQTT